MNLVESTVEKNIYQEKRRFYECYPYLISYFILHFFLKLNLLFLTFNLINFSPHVFLGESNYRYLIFKSLLKTFCAILTCAPWLFSFNNFTKYFALVYFISSSFLNISDWPRIHIWCLACTYRSWSFVLLSSITILSWVFYVLVISVLIISSWSLCLETLFNSVSFSFYFLSFLVNFLWRHVGVRCAKSQDFKCKIHTKKFAKKNNFVQTILGHGEKFRWNVQ